MELYCDYDEESWCERERYDDDPWDNGDYAGRWWVTGVSLSPGFREGVETADDVKVDDKVWIVYVSYNSGSTFGTDGPYGSVISATKSLEQAQAVMAWCEEGADWPEGVVSRHRYWSDGSWGQKGWQDYRPWDGYFEWGQMFYIQQFEVKE